MATVTGISSISFVGTVVNDPTMQNLGKTDHSYYTYTNATIKTVATVSPANATNQTVTWSYVNNSGTPVSAIDASGNITFSGTEGIVTITAHAQDTSSGSYNTTIKLSVVYPDYTFNITNSHAAVRTDSTGKKWVEYRTYSGIATAIGDTKLELTSTLYGGTANTNYRAYNSSTNAQVGFGNISSDGTSSSTYDSFSPRTTPLYGNLPKLNGTDYKIYAHRLGPYYIGYNVRVQDALSNLAVSINSTTSGPTATTDGTYSYFYVGSTVVVQAALQIYGSQNIADIYDASANWIAGPEFTVTRLVGTYTVGGVSGLFLQSDIFYHRASITVNSYTATPTLRIQATSPDTINSGFNTVILRSVTGMNSITGTTTVQTGSTTTLASSVQPATAYNQSITWSSSDTAIATVNTSTGVVTGVSPGTATITAASAESASFSSTATVTVTGIAATSISAIEFTGSTPVRTTSTGLSVLATVSPANATNKGVTYTSSNTGVATVDASGVITPVAAGTTTITATASDTTNGTLSFTYSLTVYNPVAAISAITRTGFPTTIYTDSSGLSIAASITTTNVADSGVVYSSSETGVATVNASTGAVTIVGLGSVTLTATSSENSGVSSTTTFTVYNRVAAMSDITTSGFPATVYTTSTGLSISASVTTSSVANSAVAYSSSDTGVATIDSTGAIAIIAAGTTTLRAESVENSSVYKTYSLTVNSQQMTTITGVSLADSNANTLSQMTLSIPTGNPLGYYHVYAGEQSYIDITLTRSDSSTDNATFVVYNAETDALIDPSNMDIILNNSENNYAISNYPGPGIYKIEASINGGSVNTFYLQIKAAITDITSTATASEVSDGEGTVTAYNVTQSQTMQLTITRSDINNTDTITFTILDTINGGTSTGISVAQDGTVTATTLGLYTIISRLNSIMYSSNIYIQVNATVAVTGISSTTLSGGTAPFYTTTTGLSVSATVQPANASNQTVSYSSSATGVATVNSSTGAITIVGAGSTTITSTSADGSYTSTYALTVSVPTTVATTSLSEITSDHTVYNVGNYNDRIIYVDSTETSVQLYTSVQPENATNQAVTWQFYLAGTHPDATISSTGLVTFTASSSSFTYNLDPLVSQGGFSKRVIISRAQPPINTNSIYSQGTEGIYKTMNDIVGGSGSGTVAVTGISSTSLSGGTAPFYTTSTGLSVSATVQPANASNQTVSYSSSETSVATVNSSTGAITVVGAGSTTITSTSANGSYTSTYALTVSVSTNVATTGLSEITSDHTVYNVGNYNDRIMYVGSTETSVQLYTSVQPENATNQAVTWQFYLAGTHPDATISSTGLITFTASSSLFTYTLDPLVSQGGFSKRVLISRTQPPTTTNSIYSQGTEGTYKTMNDIVGGSGSGTVAVTGISSTTLSGGSAPFYTTSTGLSVSATVQPANASNQTVSYSSSETSVATVNSSTGALTIVAAGSTTITSTSSDGSYTSTYSLTVYNRPAAISALTGSWGASTVYTTSTGLSVSATVTTSSVYNSAVTYSSSSTAVATVDASGAITVVGAGSTTLSAVPADNTNSVAASTLSLTVSTPLPANSVTSMTDIVLESTDPMHPNQWNNASVILGPANATDKSVTWTSSNSSILAIWDDDGVTQDVVIVAKGIGAATLRATSVSNTSIYKEITVQIYARTTGMSPITFIGSTPYRVGDSARLQCAVIPYTSAYPGVTWSSSNTDVITVDASGNLTGISAGTCVIYASSVGIPVRTVTYSLTVAAAATRVSGISTIAYSGSAPFRVSATSCNVSATVEPATATNTTITYTSSDTNIAEVASTGRLTGNSVGTCTITATTADGGYTSTFPLTVDVAYIQVTAVSNLTLTAPSPIYANSTGVSVSGLASGLSGATPTNPALLYYTNTVGICSINKDTGVVTFKAPGTANVFAVSSDNPTIRSTILGITVLPTFVALTGISDISANNQSPVLVGGQKTLYIRNGGILQLRASPVPVNATNNAITWASSSAGITVDASGLATSVTTNADTVITGTDASGNNKTVNVKHITNVQGVNLISLSVESPLTINTTSIASSGTYPENATYPGVTWSASPVGIVTIDQSGNVTGIAPGNTTIYATAVDNSGIIESYPITVSVPFVEITGMSQITYTGPKYLHVNETGGKISAYVMPANATNQVVAYTWSPLNLLSIDASGNITALASGTVTIYASATETNGITVHDSEYVLTIYAETVNITGIDCLVPDVVLDIGSTIGFRNPMLPPYATNNQVTWVSADPEIASVNENGTVTGVTRGTTNIIATSAVNGILNSSYEITISSVPVSDITPIGTSTSAYSMIATNTLQLSAQVVPSNAGNKVINWFVSDISLATIDASGILTAIAPGYIVVRASADDNSSIYRETTIIISSKPVTGISVITSPSNVRTIELNSTMTLSANVLPTDATNKALKWTSNLPSLIEIVDASAGTIRGKLISGTSVTITATTVEGNYRAFYNMTCVAIKVQDMDPITTSTGDLQMNNGDSLTLITQILPVTAAVRDYAWSYNASTTNALQLMQSVASFNVNTATVSALTPGYASFKATSGGKTNAGEYIVKTITIQVGEPVQSLTPILYGISSVLQATQTKQVTTSIVPSSASQSGIFWSCSQTGAATISQTGVISVARFPTGKTFTITATPTPYNLDASGNIIAVSQTFTITIPVTGISAIAPSRTTISVGENRNMNAYIQPINADNKNTVLSVVSATNNAGQAVVDTSTILYTNGIIIRGIAKGSAIIKIESAENAAIFSTLNITIV